MKFLFTIFLITSFIGVAVFGTFGMDRDGQGRGGRCIAAIVHGGGCPREADPIAFAAFHLDGFRMFSLATFGKNAMSALLFVFAFLLFIGLGIFSSFLFKPSPLAFSRSWFQDYFFSSQQRKLNRWLALRENSPVIF